LRSRERHQSVVSGPHSGNAIEMGQPISHAMKWIRPDLADVSFLQQTL
jgi:hypothetical protein